MFVPRQLMVYSDAKIFNCIFFLKDPVVQDVILGEGVSAPCNS